ncbi:MAG: histidine phosphatase family protein [Armatimonadetes bacterium]|nr:histidine phosphatase family protein [Anaerolineae bacterium]
MSEPTVKRNAYLIRHGQTQWNIEKRWQGIYDTPLNEEGRQQAGKLAAYLHQHHPIEAIYSSDLSRAWDTALAISALTGITPTPETRLREIHVGIFQGHTGVDLEAMHPLELAQYRANTLEYIIPEGESRLQVQTRTLDAWQDITTNTTGSFALISHGMALWLLLGKLFPERILNQEIHIGNTSITTLNETANGWQLDGLAQTQHLINRR